ncbi:hypothetical protein [Bifidobacterium simiiventris]|uniref:hypothetical protein n=1 Tax=Bifidobacterium simiiventris TaxID=2834434 RepID=UPI001C56F96E|nr:hypothetical protein [Bifidobacterium simiiventris]MBW3079059.1 hypothetical protein [Bifidobacterium simiiventris]
MGNAVVHRESRATAALGEWQGSRQLVRRLIRRRLWRTFGPLLVVMTIGLSCGAYLWSSHTAAVASFLGDIVLWEYGGAAIGCIALAVAWYAAWRSASALLPRAALGVCTGEDFPFRLVRKPHDNSDLELGEPDFRVSMIVFPADLTRVFTVLEWVGGEADVCWTIMQVSNGRLRVVGRDAVDPGTRLACARQYATDDLDGVPLDEHCTYDQRNSVLIVR